MRNSLWIVVALAALNPLPAAAQTAPEAEPVLAAAPVLKRSVPAALPPGTRFPAPAVAVVLTLEVDEAGRVASAAVAEGVGEPFDGAALEAARGFEFEPGRLSTGEAVPVTVTFRLSIQEPPPPPVTVLGRLLEAGTRKPLADVPVAARRGDETLFRAETGADGRFALTVPATAFAVVATAPGHERLEATIEAVAGESREVTWYVEPRGSAFETVVRAESPRSEVGRIVIPRSEVQTLAGTSGDALKAVQNLPGVGRSPPQNGAPILRGSSPGDSRVLLDGQEIPQLYHFGALRSTFATHFLDEIEFVPGNFGPEYGRALGGIVNVKARDPASDQFRGMVDLNLYDAGFALEGPVGNGWSLGGGFRRSWFDSYLPSLLKDADVSFKTAPAFYDYQAIAAWRPEDGRQSFKLTFYGSLDRLKLLFDDPASDPVVRGDLAARVMFHALQAEYRSKVLDNLSQDTSLQVAYQQISTEIGPDLFFDLGVTRLSLRHGWTWEAHPIVALRAGLDLQLSHVDIAFDSPRRPEEGQGGVPTSTAERFALAKKSWLFDPAGFVELRIRPVKGLEILPGLRVDGFTEIGRATVDPRLSVRYEPIAGTVVKGGVGLFQQPPRADQSDSDLGNPDLFAERAVHASLGLEQRIVDGLDVDVTGFYKWLDRLVVRNPASSTDPDAVPYVNDGRGQVYGLEFLLKARFPGYFQGFVAYTYQRSLRVDGPGKAERPFDFDQPHLLTAVGTFDLGRGWTAGFRFRLASGNPTTPVVSSVYDTRSDTYVPIYGEPGSGRLDLFHQLDLRVDKTWTFEQWKLGLFLDVQNVYNRRNPEGTTYSFDYRRSQPSSGLPILPILGLKGEW